jgi:hypothetical protein
VTVLDVSAAALARARARLGGDADRVRWIEADVTGPWTAPAVDVWHDRAVFHFLTEAEDRRRHVAHLRDAASSRGGDCPADRPSAGWGQAARSESATSPIMQGTVAF